MIKLMIGMFIFFACYPMTGCTVTPQQTQATVDTVGIIGETITEIVSIYGNPLNRITLGSRVATGGDTVEIFDYKDFSVRFENGIAVSVYKNDIPDIMKNLN